MPYPYQDSLQSYQNPSFQALGNQGGFGSFFTGSPGGTYKAPKLTGGQYQGLQGILQQAQGLLVNPYNNPRSEQAINRFHSQTVPSIAERFLGAGQERNNSSFQGALGAAGAGLEQGLAADSLKQALEMLKLGLGTSAYDTGEIEGQKGLLQNLTDPETIAALVKLLPLLGA